MRYGCIYRRRYRHSVRMMCRLLKVSRSGYYEWCHRGESVRKCRDRDLTVLIRQVHLESRGVYGARKVHRELLDRGERYPRALNLLNQDFKASRANERWASDITFIATRQGWLYLAVVMDLYSRRIVGWSMDRRVGRHLVVEAMTMALGYRQPSGPLLHHSDRGPQYASDDFRDLLAKHGIECSMSARGSCYDNAPVESFFSLLKRERIRRRTYSTREEAKADVFDYIECFYNRKRRHGYLDYISPVTFENQTMRT